MMTKRLPIVLATDSLDPSGVGEHMLTLGRALGNNFDVTIAAFNGLDGGLLTRAAQLGLAILAIENMSLFETWLGKHNITLLHVHAGIGWEGHDLARAGTACNIPVIRTEHLPYLITDRIQKRSYAMETAALAHHIVVSEASWSSFQSNGVDASRLTVVRNGIFPLTLDSQNDCQPSAWEFAGRKVLLTVARFSKQKGHTTLIEAMPAVFAAHPSAILLLVGKGEVMAATQAMVEDLSLSSHIIFMGHRTDIGAGMAMADLLVLPSLFEGLPLVVLEAMSLGLPVVATRIGGTSRRWEQIMRFFAKKGIQLTWLAY